MVAQFKHLFTPLQVGSMTVANRLMTSAMSTDFYTTNREGYAYPTWGLRQAQYHADRAKGGFGLIVAGQALVHPSCGLIRPAAFLDEIGPEYKLMADMIHEHGGKVVMQLNHNSNTRTSGTDDWLPVLSTRPERTGKPGPGGEFTKEIEIEEVESIVAGFAKSARNMQKAGLDGVEIHASHTYLLAQFMTPALNQRKDRYGGSLENRLRFTMEVIHAVRKAVGKEFVVGVRMNAQWRMPNGFTADDGREACRMIEADGKVDFLSISAVPFEESMSTTGSPFGPVIPLAAAIKKLVAKLPIYVGGRIVDPIMAEETIANGDADGVIMSRASLADPELPRKTQEGRLHEIRKCVGAGQGCLVRHRHARPITCTQNPSVGREGEWGIGSIQPVANPKTVLVAGGGPAGTQAAIVAASRGHKVILCEKADRLGGQVNLIVKNERRKEFVNEMDWRRDQIDKLGIDLRLNTEATADLVAQLRPDTVIVATGSEPIREYDGAFPGHWSPSGALRPGIPGADGPNVFTAWDVMNGALDDRKHVVILDAIGYYQSSDPLEYLATRGKKVTVVTMTHGVFPEDMTDVERPNFRESIWGKDVTIHQTTGVKEILKDAVKVHDGFTGREFTIDGVDATILSVGNVSINQLFYDVKGKVPEVHRIGDCVTPRRIEHAHFEGHKIGMEI
jgi:2,4-dienoyl-CoA reductase-like NADH-dependent reductase (Old Yellow Enzyme family)/thioredoxin reductase